jgi:ABC-type branched-subunit amino acid transport system permease subunit
MRCISGSARMPRAFYVKFGITPWGGLLAGGIIAALIALALGYPCFRLKGHYFSIATIVIAEIGLLLFHNWDYAGAALGIQWPFTPDSWWTLQFARDKAPYFYFALGLFAVTWLVTFSIVRSKWGYWWRAVKDSADAAESLGVTIFHSKMAAAAISAFFTAVGGGFYAAFVSYIDPDSVMHFRFSLLMALPAVLGGVGSLWGPAIGALILIPLAEFTLVSGRLGIRPRSRDLWWLGYDCVADAAGRHPELHQAGQARGDGMTGKPLVTCRSVTRRFDGLVANDSIDLDVYRGEILGLIGPNGAGKSTLFNLIAGAFPVSFGVIEFDGRDITPLPAADRCGLGIARTYQVPRSFDSMSVVENVTVGAFVRYPAYCRPARRRSMFWIMSALRHMRDHRLRISLHRRNGVLRWRVRLPPSRNCCCSTRF